MAINRRGGLEGKKDKNINKRGEEEGGDKENEDEERQRYRERKERP